MAVFLSCLSWGSKLSCSAVLPVCFSGGCRIFGYVLPSLSRDHWLFYFPSVVVRAVGCLVMFFPTHPHPPPIPCLNGDHVLFGYVSFLSWCALWQCSPVGSPSRGGDVVVYVKDVNQPSLPTLFHFVRVSISVLMALSTVFYSTNFPDNSPLSHFRSPVLILLYCSFQLYIFFK